MKRPRLVLSLGIWLSLTLWLTLVLTSAAGGTCPVTYVVKRGDTLNSIAARSGVSVAQLAAINGIGNPNYIYAGMPLCVEELAASPSTFDLVAEYKFGGGEAFDASVWTVGHDRIAGVRRSFDVPSFAHIQTYSTTAEVKATSVKGMPKLWLARNELNEPFTYTLVVIGDPQPLLNLQLGASRPLTEIIPIATDAQIAAAAELEECPKWESRQPVQALSPKPQITVKLRAELMGDDGTSIPVTIDAIDYQATTDTASWCYNYPGFALLAPESAQTDGHRLILVLNDDGTIGPPGESWTVRYNRWQGGGWWSRFLRAHFSGR